MDERSTHLRSNPADEVEKMRASLPAVAADLAGRACPVLVIESGRAMTIALAQLILRSRRPIEPTAAATGVVVELLDGPLQGFISMAGLHLPATVGLPHESDVDMTHIYNLSAESRGRYLRSERRCGAD
jgi:hypothetical protein